MNVVTSNNICLYIWMFTNKMFYRINPLNSIVDVDRTNISRLSVLRRCVKYIMWIIRCKIAHIVHAKNIFRYITLTIDDENYCDISIVKLVFVTNYTDPKPIKEIGMLLKMYKEILLVAGTIK